jgi:polyprenyl P-hydroxybenzoate/phenylacrylic acid decarboxylase-like protein
MSTEPRRRSVILAITGASGAVYATRTMAALLERGCHVELIVSDYGRRLLRDELGDAAAIDRLAGFLRSRYGDGVGNGSYVVHSNKDLGARVASGSQDCEAMVVVPCSMKTLAGIAHGLSRSLVERAADVMLKERRTLIIVPRETPKKDGCWITTATGGSSPSSSAARSVTPRSRSSGMRSKVRPWLPAIACATLRQVSLTPAASITRVDFDPRLPRTAISAASARAEAPS